MKFREKRKPFIISLKFRAHLTRAAQIMNVTTCSIESPESVELKLAAPSLRERRFETRKINSGVEEIAHP